MFCQSVQIGRCQCNLKRFLPLSSYQLHTLEEHNLTITSGFLEQISNCLRNLFVVQLRRLRWFKHNESCAKPNLTRICPLDMRAKPESVYLAPASACTARPSRPALPGPGLSSSFLLSLLLGSRRNVTSNTPCNAALTQSIFVETDHPGTHLPLGRREHEPMMIGPEIII